MDVLYLPATLMLQGYCVPKLLDEQFALFPLHSFKDALEVLADEALVRRYDLLLAEDWQGGWLDIATLRELNSHLPLIVMTYQKPIADARTIYLNAGADQCLPGYGSTTAELGAAMYAACRRSASDASPQPSCVYGDLKVDVAARAVFCRKTRLALTQTEFLIISMLIRAEGKLVTYEQLAASAFSDPARSSEHTLFASHMRRIRSKLRLVDSFTRICPEYGLGYALRKN